MSGAHVPAWWVSHSTAQAALQLHGLCFSSAPAVCVTQQGPACPWAGGVRCRRLHLGPPRLSLSADARRAGRWSQVHVKPVTHQSSSCTPKSVSSQCWRPERKGHVEGRGRRLRAAIEQLTTVSLMHEHGDTLTSDFTGTACKGARARAGWTCCRTISHRQELSQLYYAPFWI